MIRVFLIRDFSILFSGAEKKTARSRKIGLMFLMLFF